MDLADPHLNLLGLCCCETPGRVRDARAVSKSYDIHTVDTKQNLRLMNGPMVGMLSLVKNVDLIILTGSR